MRMVMQLGRRHSGVKFFFGGDSFAKGVILLPARNYSIGIPPHRAPNSIESSSDKNSNTFEPADDFMNRILGSGTGRGENSSSFFRKLDKAEKNRDTFRLNSNFSGKNQFENLDDLDQSFTILSDGMDEKLENDLPYFDVDEDEVEQEDYSFRPDLDAQCGMVLDTKDLDLRRPAVPKPVKRSEFETTTEEVLQKADFRNVRFLANFITEAGIIIKRSQTKISAKAQRKVAREIKTARAFGLMPFTTMGTKKFTYGSTMEHNPKDFEYYNNDNYEEGNQDRAEA